MTERPVRKAAPSVLIVEDEPAIARLLSVMLRQAGCEPTVAGSAEEALKSFEKLEPRLVIADVRLPGVDGVELVKRLRAVEQQTDSLRVILISAFEEPASHQADSFIRKPFDLEEFLLQVNSHLPRTNGQRLR